MHAVSVGDSMASKQAASIVGFLPLHGIRSELCVGLSGAGYPIDGR